MPHAKVDFSNTEIAFHLKSDAALDRAYFLFKMIANEPLVRIGTAATNFALKTHLPVEGLIRATVFDHFCGGVSENDCMAVVENMFDKGVSSVLDFSIEGKEDEKEFDAAMNKTCELVEFAYQQEAMPIAVFKPTGLASFALLEKISNNSNLTKEEEIEKTIFEGRIENICQTASDNKVPLFIDAEESWIQDAIDDIAIKMMQKFNKNEAWIYNTLQLYRNDRVDHLEMLLKLATEKKFFVGLKLVRGAYHEQEIERAKEKGYNCPVHTIKENTDIDYNKALTICIENIDFVSVCAGTHNEESSALLVELLNKHNISKDDKRVYFSQLLGMSDHISYNAAKEGFNVVKYVPYGPVKDVLPYLIRRAEENTSIAGQMGRELTNIIEEKKRRRNA